MDGRPWTGLKVFYDLDWMAKPAADDPGTWPEATPDELRSMFARASPDQAEALLAWAKANWIVEPGRIVGSQRVRHPTEPSLQVALMPGLDFRSGPLGRSSLSSVRQSLLLSAAERSSLWELRFAPREEIAAAIEWGMDAGWVTVAAERGEAGKRTGTWTDLPSEFALLELENSGNWSAGPYPVDVDFTEVFILLTASGRKAVAAGVADDAIRDIFSGRRWSVRPPG